MKLFRNRRATTRSENPQPGIRTPSLLLRLEDAFSPAFTNPRVDWLSWKNSVFSGEEL
jgi:hypothetical protein